MDATVSHIDPDWYYYFSSGAVLTTTKNHIKVGNVYIYQAGIGKNFGYSSDEWIFMGLLEFSGLYQHGNSINGFTDPNLGGHLFLIGPSLWWSTQHLIIQGGFSFPAAQKLFGLQNSVSYLFAVNVGWKFNNPSDDDENGDDDE